MLKTIVFGLLLLGVHSYPIIEENNQNVVPKIPTENDLDAKNVEELKKALHNVAYVQNFKTMMADYVKSQYKNLTDHEMDTVKEHLEEFCHKFAIDLKNIIDNGAIVEKNKIDDGLPDSTFDNVKDCIKTELPGTKDATAEDIVYVLRRNLFLTRQKIDAVINASKMAAMENH